MKSIESFFIFLEENKLHKVAPNRYTVGEIMTFASSKGFHFTREELHMKLNQLAKYEGELSGVEKNWRPLYSHKDSQSLGE